MEIGDTVVYIYRPYESNTIKAIAIVRMTRLANTFMFNKLPLITVTKTLFGTTIIDKEAFSTNEENLYEIGDHNTLRKIFSMRFA